MVDPDRVRRLLDALSGYRDALSAFRDMPLAMARLVKEGEDRP